MAEASCTGGTSAETNEEEGEIRGTNTDELVHVGDSEGTQVNFSILILLIRVL